MLRAIEMGFSFKSFDYKICFYSFNEIKKNFFQNVWSSHYGFLEIWNSFFLFDRIKLPKKSIYDY